MIQAPSSSVAIPVRGAQEARGDAAARLGRGDKRSHIGKDDVGARGVGKAMVAVMGTVAGGSPHRRYQRWYPERIARPAGRHRPLLAMRASTAVRDDGRRERVCRLRSGRERTIRNRRHCHLLQQGYDFQFSSPFFIPMREKVEPLVTRNAPILWEGPAYIFMIDQRNQHTPGLFFDL